MSAQRSVHRFISFLARIPGYGFVYRVDRVTRTGRVLDSEYVDYQRDVCWC
jgi:hypothetical protein